MSRILQSQSSWEIGRSSAACTACGAAIPSGTGCWAALVENSALRATANSQPAESARSADSAGTPPYAYQRMDFCESCWASGKRPEPPAIMFSFWKTSVPVPEQKKKLLVDDSILIDLFHRLGDRHEALDIRFRFVLALILMRKRLLRYDGESPRAAGQDPREVWLMTPRVAAGMPPVEQVRVINPHLTQDQIAEVSQQLSSILAEEL